MSIKVNLKNMAIISGIAALSTTLIVLASGASPAEGYRQPQKHEEFKTCLPNNDPKCSFMSFKISSVQTRPVDTAKLITYTVYFRLPGQKTFHYEDQRQAICSTEEPVILAKSFRYPEVMDMWILDVKNPSDNYIELVDEYLAICEGMSRENFNKNRIHAYDDERVEVEFNQETGEDYFYYED